MVRLIFPKARLYHRKQPDRQRCIQYQLSPTEAKGSRRQGCCSNAGLKEAGGESVGRRTGMPRTERWRAGRYEAGDDRDESATQDEVLYPLIGLPRISDDRALKVAEVHPGRPAASRVSVI